MAGQPPDAEVPPWSDTDVMVVLGGEAPPKAGKFMYQGVLLEGTYLAADSLADPEGILGNYHVAHAVATGFIIDDPSGWLAKVMGDVRGEFPRRHRVEARCARARDGVVNGFAAAPP